MKTNRLLAALLAGAMLLALAAAPAFALSAESYNAYDVSMLKLFFQQTDPKGVTNGEKLFEHYSPNDPSTWTGTAVVWNAGGRVVVLDLVTEADDLYGVLNVSGMTELTMLDCSGNKLTAVNVSGCTKLESLNVSNNRLTKLTVPCGVNSLNCSSNPISIADLSGVVHPYSVNMQDCPLRELHTSIRNIKVDLDTNGCGSFDFLYMLADAVGENGQIGDDVYRVGTTADEGFEFAGWYDSDDAQAFAPTDHTNLWADGMKPLELTAMFTKSDDDDPAEPDPTDPAEPDPTDPTDPAEPDPTDPTDPAEPDPTEPAEPDPTEPAEPDPTEPAEPDPTEPAEPDPTEPAQPGVPVTGSYAMTLLGAALLTLGVFGAACAIVTLEQRGYKKAAERSSHRK